MASFTSLSSIVKSAMEAGAYTRSLLSLTSALFM
jgi:hypothetical protein